MVSPARAPLGSLVSSGQTVGTGTLACSSRLMMQQAGTTGGGRSHPVHTASPGVPGDSGTSGLELVPGTEPFSPLL